MTTITKLKPEVVFQYGFHSFLQHHKLACAIICIFKKLVEKLVELVEKLQNCKKTVVL